MNNQGVTIGVHIAERTLWVAAVDGDGAWTEAPSDRIKLATGSISPERALAELEASTRALLDRFGPDLVALLQMGTSPQRIKTTTVLERGRLEAALMIACAQVGCALHMTSHAELRTNWGAGPNDSALQDLLATRLPADPPTQWGKRAPAFAAALTVREAADA